MACNLKPNKINYYNTFEKELDDFNVDQTVIISGRYLKNISFLDYKVEEDKKCESVEIYPFVNSYYNHSEDSDPLNKVNSLLAQPEILEASIEKNVERPTFLHDTYSEREAQIRYLESKPVSFIILGKPDIGQQDLGRQLANYWNCVYIEPETLIEEEIESGSRAGQCIEFNLKCGRAVGIDIILTLVQKRVQSESARHKGFVIAGLPVVPNDLYEEDPVSSQSAVFTATDIFEELFGVITTYVSPSKLQVSVSSKYKSDIESASESQINISEKGANASKNVISKEEKLPIDVREDIFNLEVDIGQNYEEQLNFLFNLLEDPYFIIYIQCGTADVLNKRDSYRFDIFSNQLQNTQNRSYNKIFHNLLINENDLGTLTDIYDPNILDIDDFRQKGLVKLPCDFRANVTSQLDRYHKAAINFIQNRIIAHDPEYFIKVDGRTTITKMLTLIKAKLKIMNLQQVLVPNKLIDTELDALFKTEVTLLPEDGYSPRSEVDTGKLTPAECFKQFKKQGAPSPIYMWTWSEWGSRCPVSMKNGFIKEGDVNYAVQFINKIYFLADQEAYLKFCLNPRPYLLPPYPKTTCKIFIFGPRLSGKSALAQCLSYYYNGTVLSTNSMMKEFMHQRQGEYIDQIRQQAITEALALLNKQRRTEAEQQETARIEKIREWVKTVIGLLEQMDAILMEIEKEEKKEHFEISSFPMAMKRVQTADVLEDSEYAVALANLREEISNLNIPIYKLDPPQWRLFFTERKKLLQYLPHNIAIKIRSKPATVFDDFVKEYVENAVTTAGSANLQLTFGSIIEMFINYMKAAEEKYFAQGFGRGGWIIDGMMCSLEIIKDFYPNYIGDEVIVLKDSDNFFVKRYEDPSSTTFFRDFRSFFKERGIHDAAWRSPSLTSTKEYKEGLVQSILQEILERDDFFQIAGEEKAIYSSVDEYKKDIINFETDWLKIKQFYLDHNIKLIEINVSNKTLPELFEQVIKVLDSDYQYKAHQVTQEDRAEEVIRLGYQDNTADPGGEDASVVDYKTGDVIENTRKFGDTYHFCPVTFLENFVLWQGKEDFAVKYNEKVYLLATETDMKKFVENPLKYVPTVYPERFPQPRICVIGVSGCGRSFLSHNISENYGLSYISYEKFLKDNFNIKTNENLNELRNTSVSALRSYLNGELPLPDSIFHKLRKYWFDEPYFSRGFVFDDFPKSHHDFDFMVKNKLIPEVILYLTADEAYIKTKLLARRLELWQKDMDKQRLETETRQNRILEKLKEQRVIRFNELIEERREQRYTKKLEDKARDIIAGEGGEDAERSVSQITFDSVAEQEDIDEVNKILDAELPPPVFDTPIEDAQAFISKTERIIDNAVQAETAAIKKIKEKCLSHQIRFEEIPLNIDILETTKKYCYFTVEPLKIRIRSFFESCYLVSLELADKLLSSGYCFLSKFGKMCPVQYYENKNAIQMYLVAEENNNLYAVVHRSYIYFIVGHKQRDEFIANPLKYLAQGFRFPLLSFKVAVTGPPKCGKTVLAQRIQKEYGFQVVSRGQATRYVLKYLSKSDLAKNMETVLRKGWELTDEMVIKAVEAATFDKRAITQGVIFDGFPNTLNEVKHLSYTDLVPNIVIDLQGNEDEILECLENDRGTKSLPKYGKMFMSHLYNEWRKEAEEHRDWFDKEYQAMAKIPINTCNWSVWHQTNEYIQSTFWEVKHYHKHIMDNWPLRLANMLVTPLEFIERSCSCKTYCPLCLHFSNSLNSGGEPPDRTGLVQFREYFYWLCNDHIDMFLKSPEMYLPPYNKHGMPSNLPKKATFDTIPDNVYEHGSCAVCYKLKRIITQGKPNLAVNYKDKSYLFDSEDCLDTFLRQPHLFLFGIEFRAPVYPELKYKDLPVMGMLEQYVAKYIVQAISYIAKRRPIIPGLGISASALIGIGMFIKVKNEQLPFYFKPYYEEGFRLYNERRDNLLKYLDVMKKYRNPYLHYDEPLPAFELPPATPKSESLTTMISKIVDQCVDNIDIYLTNPENI